MTDKSVEECIKAIVMANHDDEIKSIAVVFINGEGEPELEIGVNSTNLYKIIAALEILKMRMIDILVLGKPLPPPKDRT